MSEIEKDKINTEGVKFDNDKNRYDLLAYDSLDKIVQVYTFGAKKYNDWNWAKGMKWGRVFGAIQRHLTAFWQGEDLDPESKLPHLSHAGWGILTLLNYMDTKPELDDRYKLKKFDDKDEIKFAQSITELVREMDKYNTEKSVYNVGEHIKEFPLEKQKKK